MIRKICQLNISEQNIILAKYHEIDIFTEVNIINIRYLLKHEGDNFEKLNKHSTKMQALMIYIAPKENLHNK